MCETVKASIVDAIPKRTSSVIHPDALLADVVAVADMTADYRRRRVSPSTSMRETQQNSVKPDSR
jgi:hypothetical protein